MLPKNLKLFISQHPIIIHQVSILGLFTLLTLVMLYPLSITLNTMVPEPTDPLLNSWRMHWVQRALLSGLEVLRNIFNPNIFYPYPLTLVYSEHFIGITALALPFMALTESHLVGLNLSVLLTFILSGYGMYLLLLNWTNSRWAGVIAGIIFAFSPHRFGQLNHLELLITAWMPLTLLTLQWTLTRPGWRRVTALIVFLSLQSVAGFHYFFNLLIAATILCIAVALTRRILWRRGLWLAGGLAIAVITLLNAPIWWMYLQFSDHMGAIRTPGEVRIYSAAFTDYLTTIPHNYLYGWTFGHWQFPGHQFQPLMPLGVMGLFLAVMGVWYLIQQRKKTRVYLLFLISLFLIALLLSFGLNENALGESLAPILTYSPYHWLYENILVFQAIRVPARFGVLVVLSTAILAGFGIANYNLQIATYPSIRKLRTKLEIAICIIILFECWSVPLHGPEFAVGEAIPPVYQWVATHTAPDAVILELPHYPASEFLYEYYSSYHWRRLANGGTGYTPPIYKAVREWLTDFPSARTIDLIQQMGITYILLHQPAYSAEEWQRIHDELPRYMSAFTHLEQVGQTLVITMALPTCQPDPTMVHVTLKPGDILDGVGNTIAVTYHNQGKASFRADVTQVSQLKFENQPDKNFTEPLITPPGESQTVLVPLSHTERPVDAWLATLNRLASDEGQPAPVSAVPANPISLGLQFADGPHLLDYTLSPETPTPCGQLMTTLSWQKATPGDLSLIQLLDPFGRVVTEQTLPFVAETELFKRYTLPLVGSLPPGQYGLRVRVFSADEQERQPITEEGVTIPPDMIPPLPVVVGELRVKNEERRTRNENAVIEFVTPESRVIKLVGYELFQDEIQGNEWIRFSLAWQAEMAFETDYTIFTQLLGPDGQVWGQYDNQPHGGWYPMSLWQSDEIVTDDIAFPLQADAPTGQYRLIVGLYESDSQTRLLTKAGADFVEIGIVSVKK